MDKLIFALCGTTALLCALLLLRGHFRSKSSLLLWSGCCFVLLSLSNFLIIVDRWVLPESDLSILRLLSALVGMMLLIYGLIWESE